MTPLTTRLVATDLAAALGSSPRPPGAIPSSAAGTRTSLMRGGSPLIGISARDARYQGARGPSPRGRVKFWEARGTQAFHPSSSNFWGGVRGGQVAPPRAPAPKNRCAILSTRPQGAGALVTARLDNSALPALL